MNSVLQEILKYNPKLSDDVMPEKFYALLREIVNEKERQRAARGYETFDAEEGRIYRLAAAAGGGTLADEFDSLIGTCMTLYTDAGFALGYHTAKHPEWVIFEAHTTNE